MTSPSSQVHYAAVPDRFPLITSIHQVAFQSICKFCILGSLVTVHTSKPDRFIAGLDYLSSPTGTIKEAQELAAAAFGADATWFLVNGTTAGIQAAVLATCGPGDALILARNCHLAAFSAMALSGCHPIYVMPGKPPITPDALPCLNSIVCYQNPPMPITPCPIASSRTSLRKRSSANCSQSMPLLHGGRLLTCEAALPRHRHMLSSLVQCSAG